MNCKKCGSENIQVVQSNSITNGEIWKDIEGYEGFYEISNKGRVKSLGRNKINNGSPQYLPERMKKLSNKIKKTTIYKIVRLHKNSKVTNYFVHRLVAFAFIPNPNNYSIINHKDECGYNNISDNLEWCTAKYNTNYGSGISRRIAAIRENDNFNNQKILCISTNKEFNSLTEAAKEYGIDMTGISRCCKGVTNTCGGYKWECIG